MEGLVNTPSKIVANHLHWDKTFSSSSDSSNRSCLGFLYARFPHRKRFPSSPLLNSEVGLGIETAGTKFLQTDGSKVARSTLVRGSKKQYSSNKKKKKNLVDTEDGESLVIYDEGHVLVPGLTAQMITEEALAEELHKSTLADSRKSMKDNVEDIQVYNHDNEEISRERI